MLVWLKKTWSFSCPFLLFLTSSWLLFLWHSSLGFTILNYTAALRMALCLNQSKAWNWFENTLLAFYKKHNKPLFWDYLPAKTKQKHTIYFVCFIHPFWNVSLTPSYLRGNLCHHLLTNSGLLSFHTGQVWTLFFDVHQKGNCTSICAEYIKTNWLDSGACKKTFWDWKSLIQVWC